MVRRFLSAVIVLLGLGLLGCSTPTQFTDEVAQTCEGPVQAGRTTRSVVTDGTEREYLLSVPEVGHTEPLPLLLAFHGRGGSAAGMASISGLAELPALVVFAQAQFSQGMPSWQGAPYAPEVDDVAYAVDIVRQVREEFCVDDRQVNAIGFSNGGGLTSLLACQRSDIFTAVATVSGAYYQQAFDGCDRAMPMPVIAFHGTNDQVINFDGGQRNGENYVSVTEWVTGWVERNDCHNVLQTDLGGVAHTSWSDCYDDADVELYVIADGGHVWPGGQQSGAQAPADQQVDATTIIWGFLSAHREP
ncbi:alpha/beta hydrolase family esterase [Naumannella halotolerans]|uniref:alpha/beta hydrolase family esterase n=1 Tax=Naumannella halotolerans TaxID=993414 RepID=UPI00370D3879